MKKTYFAPEAEVISFYTEEKITSESDENLSCDKALVAYADTDYGKYWL